MKAIYANLSPCHRPGKWMPAPVKRSAIDLVHRLHARRGGHRRHAVRVSAYVFGVAPGTVEGWIIDDKRGGV